jgi:hypothetical protein
VVAFSSKFTCFVTSKGLQRHRVQERERRIHLTASDLCKRTHRPLRVGNFDNLADGRAGKDHPPAGRLEALAVDVVLLGLRLAPGDSLSGVPATGPTWTDGLV